MLIDLTVLSTDWFVGLSKQFLSLKEAKVLVLAGENVLLLFSMTKKCVC